MGVETRLLMVSPETVLAAKQTVPSILEVAEGFLRACSDTCRKCTVAA